MSVVGSMPRRQGTLAILAAVMALDAQPGDDQ